jgi:hypothetical protein
MSGWDERIKSAVGSNLSFMRFWNLRLQADGGI